MKKKICLVMLLATIVVVIVSIIAIVVIALTHKETHPPANTYIPSVTPTAPSNTPEPTETQAQIEHQAYLGDYLSMCEVSEGRSTGKIKYLTAVFGSLNDDVQYSIEQLLSPYLSEVHSLQSELPTLYVGDKRWDFQDKDGNHGQVILYDDKLYLFYYNDSVQQADPVITAGFPATSYGYYGEPAEEYKDSNLTKHLSMDEVNRILSALCDGEHYTVDAEFILVNQRIFTRLGYFGDIEVKPYLINISNGPTFVELYLTEDKYYSVKFESDNYERILTDSEGIVQEEEEPVQTGDGKYAISDFYDSIVTEYVWDGEVREIFSSVEKASSSERVQQILQYTLECYGVDSCEFIGETAFINGYEIRNNNVFTIQLSTTNQSNIDYYVSVTESSGNSVILPANVTPKE